MSIDKATVSQWISGDMQFGFTTERGDWVMVKSLYGHNIAAMLGGTESSRASNITECLH